MSSSDQRQMTKTSMTLTYEWKERSACKNWAPKDGTLEENPFYPTDPEIVSNPMKLQKYINTYLPCKTCPVKKECGEYGILNNELGVWGGKLRTLRSRYKD